jgi:hypothetical protein
MARRERLIAFALNPRGDGAWPLDRKGNIFAFGTAPEFREVPEPQPWRGGPFVGIASTPSGQGSGYWTTRETSFPSATLRNSGRCQNHSPGGEDRSYP